VIIYIYGYILYTGMERIAALLLYPGDIQNGSKGWNEADLMGTSSCKTRAEISIYVSKI
jgi:hypothetical protein